MQSTVNIKKKIEEKNVGIMIKFTYKHIFINMSISWYIPIPIK